jgi:hypothetical protein
MSDEHKHPTLAQLGSQIIAALSPPFLMLILLNILFIGILFWFVDARAQHSMAVINQLLHACLKDQP